MLLPWDQEVPASPQERMKLKLQQVAANRAARHQPSADSQKQSAHGKGKAEDVVDREKGHAKRARPDFAFEVDDDDHCETPAEAYEDIAPFLRLLAQRLGKHTHDLRIYDPYFCNGAVAAALL